MSFSVAQCVIQIICENHGSLDFMQLQQFVGQKFTVADEVLLGVLHNSERICIIEGKEKATGSKLSPDSIVVAKTTLRVCRKPTGDCPQCDCLHLCRYYVCGKCIFGDKCKNLHSLHSSHNLSVLKKLGLEGLKEMELFSLLLQSDPDLLPEICPHYNKGLGEHGSCKFKTSCKKLHLCLHFLQGDCVYGPTCKRSHTFDATAMKCLTRCGLSPENEQKLNQIYKNKLVIQGFSVTTVALPPQPVVKGEHALQPPSSPLQHTVPPGGKQHPSISTSEADRNEICLFFIRKHCSFKDKCVRVHYHLPYKWQVLDRDGVTWRDLPNMEEIEVAYSDPRKDTSGQILAVNFLKMELGDSPVRRLSTSSSVTKPPHFILTTQWLWYWKDVRGQWVEYGQDDGEEEESISSSSLEKAFQADSHPEVPFARGEHKYVLHLKEMYQQNLIYKTKREVRRRPYFLSEKDVEAQLKSYSASSQLGSSESPSSSSSVNVPQHWDKKALADFTYKLVPLPGSLPEYKMVEKLFKSTMASSTIRSIKRIQNVALWRVFQWQKEQMTQRNGGKAVDEKHLFHGTDPSLIDAICEQNFDWRVCGTNGTLYGRGSYFARDASYSNNYAGASGSSVRIMFVALVLVGESIKGMSSYVKPPAKNTVKGFYDSCVDREDKPGIFVVFEKHQIYPEYIIEYS